MMRGIKKAKLFKAFIVPLVMGLLLFFAFPRDVLATRSFAGGGELAKFSWSDFALTVGIALVSYGIGDLIGGSSLNSAFSASNMIQGYNTYMATSQVSRAVGMAGSYHEWDPRWTFAISTMATGATAGFLNPELALAKEVGTGIGQVNPISLSSMGKGALVGGLGGAAQGATIALIDGDRLDDYKSPGVVAQVAGMAAGIYATGVGRAIFDPATYHYQIEGYYDPKPDGLYHQVEYKDGNIVTTDVTWAKDKFPYGDPFATGEATVGPYKSEVFGGGLFGGGLVKVTNTQAELSSSQIQSNLFISPLKDTINQWPELGTSALTICAVDYFLKEDGKIPEDKEYLEPLVSAVVSSVASPILHSISSTYSLRFMDEGDKMVQVAMMRKIAFEHKMEGYIKESFGKLTPEEKLSTNVQKQIGAHRNELQAKYIGNRATGYEGKGIDEVLKDAKLTKREIFLGQAWHSARFGLLHGLVSGGLQSVIAKNWDLEDSPVNYMLASSVANLGSALVRGVVWHATWEPAGAKWLTAWEISKGDPKYEEFGSKTGIVPSTETKEGKVVTVRRMEFSEQRPMFGQAIGESFRLAAIDYTRNAFLFGRPYLYKPEDVKNITSLDWVNYVGRLRYFSNLGITSALASSAGGAHIGAAATNIKTSVSHIPVLRDIFSVQPQRFASTNAPKMPFTLQTLGYESSLTNVKTTFFAPFDTAYIKISTDPGEIIRNIMSEQMSVEGERLEK